MTFLRHNLGQLGIVLVMVILLVIFNLIKSDFLAIFFHPNNLANIGRQTTLLLITSFAMTFIILSGEIDISIGAIASMCCVIIALMLSGGTWFPLAILASLGVGSLLGLLNGVITVYGKIPSFIVTLGTLSVIRGIALAVTNASTITYKHDVYRILFARGTFLGIPAPVWFALIIFLILLFVLQRTHFGSNVYAVGGNELSSRLAGIPTRAVKIGVFALSGALVALAAVVYTARLGNGQPEGMIGYELDAIAAVVIGGSSFSGGRGSLWRTVLGALLIGILNNSLVLMGARFEVQQMVKGGVIIVAVLMDYWTRRVNETF